MELVLGKYHYYFRSGCSDRLFGHIVIECLIVSVDFEAEGTSRESEY